MNLEDKAREYAEGKSSASVFRDTHIRDFKAGYEEGFKDSELLRLLKDSTYALKWYLDNSTSELTEPFFNIGMNQIVENEELIDKLNCPHKNEYIQHIDNFSDRMVCRCGKKF